MAERVGLDQGVCEALPRALVERPACCAGPGEHFARHCLAPRRTRDRFIHPQGLAFPPRPLHRYAHPAPDPPWETAPPRHGARPPHSPPPLPLPPHQNTLTTNPHSTTT